MSRGTGIALAVLLVAVAGPAGFLTYRFLLAGHLVSQPSERQLTAELAQSSQPRAAAATQSPAVSPGPQAASPQPQAASAQPGAAPAQDQSAAEPPASIPQQLPDIAFPDRDGRPRKLSDWRGRPLVVNFWATWCEPCRREIPLLESLLHGGSAGRLQIVGIAVDDRDPVLQYASTMKIDYPVLIGGEDGGLKAISSFGMAAVLPFTVFADSHGRILTVKVGELHPDEARLIIGRLLDVDAGRLTAPAAREQIETGLKTLAIERAKDSASGSQPAKS